MKKILNVLIITLIIIILTTYTNIVLAAVNKNDIENLQNEQTNITNSINDIEGKIDEVQKEKTDTLTQVNDLTSQISDYEYEIDELDEKISDLQGKITEAEVKIDEDEKKFQEQQELLNERLVAIYENGEVSYLDVLLSANNIIDFLSGYYLVSEITKYDNELLDSIEQDKEKIEAEKKDLETSKSSLDTSKKTKEAKENALKVAKKEKESKVNQLSENEKELQAQVQELKNHESSIRKKIQQMKEEYDRQLAAQNNNNSGSSSGGTSSYGFGWPVSNHRIGTGYGVKGSYWSLGYHTGVDFPVPDGTAVYSVGNGQVFDAGYSKAYGNYVEIYHGNNIYSFYAHGTTKLVSTGEKVTKGQQIMTSGHTGNVTGPHLHFEIRKPSYGFSSCVNPTSYLP